MVSAPAQSRLSLKKEQYCLYCGFQTKGRTDKRFCDVICRSAYHNEAKRESAKQLRDINNALRKNRRILAAFLSDGDSSVKVKKGRLLELGFDFQYHTHIRQAGVGKVYHYCYEYGYKELDNDWFLIVHQK